MAEPADPPSGRRLRAREFGRSLRALLYPQAARRPARPRLAPDGSPRGVARGRPACLEVAPGTWLAVSLRLPRLSRARVREAIGNELDRLTPFSASEVYYTFAVERTDAGLCAKILIVPRRAVREALSRAQVLRCEADTLLLIGEDGETAGEIALDDAVAGRVARRSAYASLLAAIFVGASTVWLPSQPPAAIVSVAGDPLTLRERIAWVATRDQDTLADPLSALALVTGVLDDGTVLDELTMEHDRITVAGRTGAVSEILARLSADPRVREPRLTRSVTRDGATRREQFGLTFMLARASE